MAIKISKFAEFINESKNTPTYKIGDLVFNKTLGNSGLVGLVISEMKKDDDNMDCYDVLYRGYGGDVIETPLEDMQEITMDNFYILYDKSDLSMYKSIAKKRGIQVNPKYDQMEEDFNAE